MTPPPERLPAERPLPLKNPQAELWTLAERPQVGPVMLAERLRAERLMPARRLRVRRPVPVEMFRVLPLGEPTGRLLPANRLTLEPLSLPQVRRGPPRARTP
ncbi:hypothetical protein ABZ297_33550 [Nonomuraea sp. NPDC005983]|uniref:hypothetical protein n=1 Tax=Nonomuraea sp. NPDC005983 TaxID=3155595 RepID=UPI0033B86E75